MSNPYKIIIWDWNGTLLDDLSVGVNTLNDMLKRRNMPILTEPMYKDRFGFPVEEFYRKIGFDLSKESLHEISVDFVATYDKYAQKLHLNPQVKEVLKAVRQKGIRQYVLSALREDLLKSMLRDFGIDAYFNQICGSDNIYAIGKIARGEKMVKENQIRVQETLMIGDTVHDAEVSEALGFDCILYAGGHNSERRLREKGKVICRLEELLEGIIV